MSFFKAAFFLASTTSFAVASPLVPRPRYIGPELWTEKQCTDQYINDARALASDRWNAAAADKAWNSVELSWNQEGLPENDTALSFSAYVGNFFHTKDRIECENLAANPCDDTILCTDATPPYPAAFLIVNSMVALHSVCSASINGGAIWFADLYRDRSINPSTTL
jgi:hypothetical protein